MDAPGVTTGDSLDQNAQNAPRCVSRSLLRDCELFSHGLQDLCTKLSPLIQKALFLCISARIITPMIYGYARVSTDGQSVDAQVKQLRAAGAEKVFRETASGAQTDRAQLARALAQLDKGDVFTVTRLDRLARSTRDLLNTLATITDKGAGFRSLGRHMGRHHDRARALDAHGSGRACGVRARIDPRPHERRQGARQGARAEFRATVQAHPAPAARGHQAPRQGRGNACGNRAQLCSYNVSAATISRLTV